MSDFPAEGTFYLEGPDGREILGASYDDEADVLYLWRGPEPVEAISFTTDEGPVVRLQPDTGELVGFTILDWAARWRQEERIEFHLPVFGESQDAEDAEEPETRSLVLVG
jgi:hypothetical protein